MKRLLAWLLCLIAALTAYLSFAAFTPAVGLVVPILLLAALCVAGRQLLPALLSTLLCALAVIGSPIPQAQLAASPVACALLLAGFGSVPGMLGWRWYSGRKAA